MTMITIDHMNFELMENYRDAFDEEQFKGKYSEVLNKYDYIVGDIGYEKLRLAGFFRDNKKKVERDKKYSAIEDYLNEYCNFGCAYFVLRKVTKAEIKEKELSADDREENVTDVEEVPGTTPRQEQAAAGEPEAPKSGSDKEVRERTKLETDWKKKRKPEQPRQKSTQQKREKDESHNETTNKTPQNKTFASFQRGR